VNTKYGLAAAVLFLVVACSDATPTTAYSPVTPGQSPGSSSNSPVAAAAVVVTISGHGSKVAKVHLLPVDYIVDFAARGGVCLDASTCIGDNFIADLTGGSGPDTNLANEITPDNLKKYVTGETLLQGLQDDGIYLVKIQTSSPVTWKMVFTPAK
jgi:hypothetical protein